MESMAKEWFVRNDEGKVYGPADLETLKAWARDGRIEPTGFVSKDRINWTPPQLMAELDLKWLVETEPGKVFGPFHRAVVSRLFAEGSVPKGGKAYRLHEFPIDEDPPPVIKEVEKVVEKIVEVVKEVPVEKVVERVVEKIVEVEPPARTEIVVPEVVEPVAKVPPAKSPGAIFNGMDRRHLMALEAAAQRELSHHDKLSGLFGRKK